MIQDINVPNFETKRLLLDAFAPDDQMALARILADPDVTKNITANASTRNKCLRSAEHRIGWHNRSWATNGYGVWAVRTRQDGPVPAGTLIGWCGFVPPDVGTDPEILYGLHPQAWGHGFATEAARSAMDWLFSATHSAGVSAIVLHRLNPASIAVIRKLGLTLRGTMKTDDFYSDKDLARDVLDYEIWRLAEGQSRDYKALLFEAPHKAGQIVALGLADREEIAEALCASAYNRPDFDGTERDILKRQICDAYCQGIAEPYLEWYHLARPRP